MENNEAIKKGNVDEEVKKTIFKRRNIAYEQIITSFAKEIKNL